MTTLSGLSGGAQPDPVTDARGVFDAGNWSVSASWTPPATAVSGVYLAKLLRTDNNATNQIPFVVRDDASHSDIVFQTSDTTWHAYNGWAGRNGVAGASLYGGFVQPAGIAPDQNPVGTDRAFAVSYNRPFITRDGGGAFAGPQDYLFGAEYAAIFFLEKNGYDVTYIAGVDTDRLGAGALNQHKAFLSVGHDEYWSGAQRANVEAARNAGLNLFFWSGNEVYWKTRWENSIADAAAYRTLVCYKETKFNYTFTAAPQDYAHVDPSNEWTGTWRDVRFANAVGADGVTHVAAGAKPENALTGQLFGSDGTGEFGGALDVPAPCAGRRAWRNPGVAAGGATGLAPGILGYEWDASPEDALRPPGLIKLSATTLNWGEIIVDQGNRELAGSATHNLSLYRAPGGALVFGAGTVFWSWALSDEHDAGPYSASIETTALKQLTLNLFADIGVQPAAADQVLTAQGLVRAQASADATPATTTLDAPPANVTALAQVTLSGSATDNGGKVAVVEVSFDGGQSWKVAQGTAGWTYLWTPTAQGSVTVLARAIDDSLNIPGNAQTASRTIAVGAPVAPSSYSLFPSSVTPAGLVSDDAASVELGVKFRAAQDGRVTQIRYFRTTNDAGDTDARAAHLWSPAGALLGTANFSSAAGRSGWQTAALSPPVTITAGSTYVASYHTEDNYFAAAGAFNAGVTDPFGMLSAPANGAAGGNGVFAYGSGAIYPNQSAGGTNYWVDVVFVPSGAPAVAAPSTPDLAAASDTGSSNTDNVTSTKTPTLTGTATAGALVKLFDGASQVGSATAAANGAWSITTASLADGDHVFTATATTANGTSPASGSLTVTIDSVAPVAPSVPDMTAASDNGASSTDNSTSFTTPIFTGTLAGGAGAIVPLLEGATKLGSATVAGDGSWTIASTPLSVGAHSITARATDPAGNVGPVSGALPVTIVAGGGPAVSLFGPSVTPAESLFNDAASIELGVKFKSTKAGRIIQLRYYRSAADAADVDVRPGHLWSSTGALLGTVSFSSPAGQSGWQTANLSTPVAITAGTTYVVSYHTENNYMATANYFSTTYTEPAGVLSAPSSTTAGGNGVFIYGSGALFPNQSSQATNYWVDVVYAP